MRPSQRKASCIGPQRACGIAIAQHDRIVAAVLELDAGELQAQGLAAQPHQFAGGLRIAQPLGAHVGDAVAFGIGSTAPRARSRSCRCPGCRANSGPGARRSASPRGAPAASRRQGRRAPRAPVGPRRSGRSAMAPVPARESVRSVPGRADSQRATTGHRRSRAGCRSPPLQPRLELRRGLQAQHAARRYSASWNDVLW